jgi:hypothetical protein
VGTIFVNLPVFRIGWQNARSASAPVPCIDRDQFSIGQCVHPVPVLHLFVVHLLAFMPVAGSLYFLIGWPRTWTLLREYISHGAQQTCETVPSLQSASVTMRSSFTSDCLVYLHLSKVFCFILRANAMITHPAMNPPPPPPPKKKN